MNSSIASYFGAVVRAWEIGMIKKVVFTLAVSLGLLGTHGARVEAKKPTYTNPVIDKIGLADPCVIFFEGKYYLYYAQLPGFRIHVQRMKRPLQKAGKPIQIIRPTEPWEKKRGAVTEGPWMLKHNKTYYLLYSGTGANSLDYAVGYATAQSPAGPFVKYADNPIVKRGKGALGPGHGCVVKDAKGKLWHVYHQQKDGSKPWNRFLCIDPLWFDAKGVLHGKATRGTPQPAPATARKKPGNTN